MPTHVTSADTLTQAATHGSPDTDTATTALHHTLGTGANQAAAGNHTHAQLHDAVTITDTTSINLTLTGQQISADAIFGTTSGTVAEGNHTHAQLHDAVTVADSTSIDLTVTGQQVSAAAIFGTTSGTVAEGNHTHAQLHDAVTVADSTSIDLTVTGQQISAAAIFGTTSGTVAEGSHNHNSAYQPLDTQLTDLAGLSYSSNSLKVVRVNAGETAFELATISSSGLTHPQVLARSLGS